MVFDIGNLYVKGREWKVGKGRSRGPTSNGRDRKGEREGRGKEEREKKWRGAACPNNTKSFPPPPRPVSINLGARLKCYRRPGPMAPNGIRHKADTVKPQIPKPRAKLSVPVKARWPMPTTSSKALAFTTKVTLHNMPRSKACKRSFCYVVK